MDAVEMFAGFDSLHRHLALAALQSNEPKRGIFLMPTAKEVLRFLKKRGFIESRQRGSHLILKNPETGYRTIVPMHAGDLPKGLFLKILKDAGFSLEDYLSE